MKLNQFDIKLSELGKKSQYFDKYKPNLLFAIPRKPKREKLLSDSQMQFYGIDIWNAYELYWINPRGVPQVRIAEIIYDANSEFMIESKSLKLYLNSFNNTKFKDSEEVRQTIISDLSNALNTQIDCNLYSAEEECYAVKKHSGILLDNLDITFDGSKKNEIVIQEPKKIIEETLYTNLLKSNCLVTGQPDFGSLFINYIGNQIDHESILQYIISLRHHNEFHEQCVERIFFEIYKNCSPLYLQIHARYTRRGGIDINPIRASSAKFTRNNYRSIRQ